MAWSLFLEDWSPAAALFLGLVAIYVFDVILVRTRASCNAANDRGQRWCFLHTFANSAVVLFGLKDLFVTLSNPAHSMSPVHRWSPVPGGFVSAIHIYHFLGFTVKPGDWFYHLAFALVGCCSSYLFNYGPIASVYFFFVCGLPGGVDYFLLGLVKERRLDPMRQRAISSWINVWIRAPGLAAVFAFAWAAYRTGDHAINLVVIAVLFVLSLFNGQYYLERVVGNYHFKLGQQSMATARDTTPAETATETPSTR